MLSKVTGKNEKPKGFDFFCTKISEEDHISIPQNNFKSSYNVMEEYIHCGVLGLRMTQCCLKTHKHNIVQGVDITTQLLLTFDGASEVAGGRRI